MANKSILDVDLIETTAEEDSFYVNSGQSLRQVKKKNVKFDYDTHVENKPSINDVELTGNKTLDELGIGSASEVASLNEKIETNKQDIADLRQSKADVMVHTAKGSHITVNNSADAFFEGLKLFGKSEQVQTKGYQLFDASKIPTKSAGGATVTNNGDGSFTISGSGNLTEYFGTNYQITDKEVIKNLFKTGKLYLKNSNTFPYFLIYFVDNEGVRTIELRNGEATITEDILNNVARVVFSIYGDINGAIARGTIRPMLYQDGDGTWEPFTGGKPSPSMDYKQDPESSGDGGTIGIGVRGNNLYYEGDLSINVKYTDFIPWTGKSKMFASLRAKTNSVDGKLDVVIDYYDANKVRLGGNGCGGLCRNTFTKYSTVFTGKSAAGTGKNVDLRLVRFFKVKFGIFVDSATQIDYKDIVITDSEGVKFSGYQPPQTLTIPTPNGLLGIKVTSDGNYTDENGQQWICDELDFKRGKYVQRVGKQVFDGSEVWGLSKKGTYQTFEVAADNAGGNGMCDTFRFVATDGSAIGFSTTYANRVHLITGHNTLEGMKGWLAQHPVTVYYQLQTPIETDIPEETMNVYRRLYTNSPSTVIQNDAGAGMEVVYSTYSKRANKDDIFNLERTIEDKFTSIVTGSDIVADGTAQGSAIIKNIPGATKQDQTKGYQLFDASEVKPASMGGATVTANSDGSYTVSGTGRLTKDFWIGGGYSHDEVMKLFKVGKLTISAKATMPRVYLSLSGSKGKHFEIYAGETVNITKEMLEDTNLSAGFGIYGSTSKEIIPGTVKPMVYQDGDGTWEPFTGGKPSPSRGYPQEITAIGEDKSDRYAVNITTHSNQLFDASKIPTKSAGEATVTNNGDGSFTISGSGNLTGNFVNSHVLSNEEAKKLFKAGRVTLKGDKTYPFVYMQIKNTAGLIKELKTLDVDGERYLDLTSEHINSEGFHVSFGIYGSSGSAIIPGTVKPMVYQDGDDAWEPFKLTTSDILLDQPLYEGDRIYLEDGELWEYRENARVVFDGSEDERWVRENSYVYIRINDSAPLTIPLVNKFVGVKNSNSSANTNNNSTISSSSALTCCLTGTTDGELQVWKTWLQSNPIEVVYKLATPTRKKLGSAEAFGIRTFDECTHIKVANSEELGTENTFIVPKNQTGGVVTDAFATAKRNEIQLEAQQSKAYDVEQRTKTEFATMLSLMPLEIQASMIENDTNNILNSLESEVTK